MPELGATKLLLLDIETRPAKVYTWSLYEPVIGVEQVIDPGGVFTFAAKWYGKKGIEFHADWTAGHDAMVQRAWDLLDECDAVIHYNGKSFDIPHLQREFMEAGMSPPSPFKQIDLCRVVKKQGRFLSNKLAHVAPQLGLKGKIGHEGFRLWLKCLDGDEVARRRMQRYNIRDVTELEDLYAELRPWIPSHPNVAPFDGSLRCRACGSEQLEKRGTERTAVSLFQRYRCKKCGAWGRATKREAGAQVTGIAA